MYLCRLSYRPNGMLILTISVSSYIFSVNYSLRGYYDRFSTLYNGVFVFPYNYIIRRLWRKVKQKKKNTPFMAYSTIKAKRGIFYPSFLSFYTYTPPAKSDLISDFSASVAVMPSIFTSVATVKPPRLPTVSCTIQL